MVKGVAIIGERRQGPPSGLSGGRETVLSHQKSLWLNKRHGRRGDYRKRNVVWGELRGEEEEEEGRGEGAGKASVLTSVCSQELCTKATKELEKSVKSSS